MRVLPTEMVKALAREMKMLGMTQDMALCVVHMMRTEQQGQEMLDYLRTEKPTDDQEIYEKMEEIMEHL